MWTWRPAWYLLLPTALGWAAGAIYVTKLAVMWLASSTSDLYRMWSGVSLFAALPLATLSLLWLAWVFPVLSARDDVLRFRSTPRKRLLLLHAMVWSSSVYFGLIVVFCLLVMPIATASAGAGWRWGLTQTLGAVLAVAMAPMAAWNRRLCRIVGGLLRRTMRRRQLCFECRYDLRTRPGGPCPECGWRDDANREPDQNAESEVDAGVSPAT